VAHYTGDCFVAGAPRDDKKADMPRNDKKERHCEPKAWQSQWQGISGDCFGSEPLAMTKGIIRISSQLEAEDTLIP